MISIYNLFEALLFSDDDFEYQFDEWINDKVKVLLIFGFSGSGKSTLAEKLADKYNCENISTDDIWKKYIIKYKNPTNDELYKIDTKILNKIYKLQLKSKHKIIVEGIHLAMIDLNKLKNYAMIIKGSSQFTSAIQSFKRDIWNSNILSTSNIDVVKILTYITNKLSTNNNLQLFINDIKLHIKKSK